MPDDEIALFNACSDLVSLKRSEAFPRSLLETKPPGEWIGVHEFCRQIGVTVGDLKSDLFATWLPDPMAHEGYAVVFFYDDASKWSMAAHCNRGRLRGDASPNQASPPAGAAIAASSCSMSPRAAPAPELGRR